MDQEELILSLGDLITKGSQTEDEVVLDVVKILKVTREALIQGKEEVARLSAKVDECGIRLGLVEAVPIPVDCPCQHCKGEKHVKT